MTVRRVSYSQINQYIRCPWLWHAEYQRGIKRLDTQPMTLGKAVHLGLAAAIAGTGDPHQVTVDYIALQPFNETSNLWQAPQIVERAISHLQLDSGKWEILYHPGTGLPLIEYPLEIRLIPRSPIMVQAVVDWVVRHKPSGAVWVVDHKVRKQFLSDIADESNLQAAMYQYMLAKAGIQTHGSMTFQIKAALPSVPKQNKDGSMSRTTIATDWSTYEKALLEAGLNPTDYWDMRQKIEMSSPFFQETRAYRSPLELENTWQEVVIPTVREMLRVGDTPARRITHLHCANCYVRQLCFEQLRGNANVEMLIEQLYAVSTPQVEITE